jgi:hypothetical protein
VGEFLKDFGHGARLLIRRPAFAAVAVASLALGIGLDTTLFSVVNAVLLRDTPVDRPERLVEIYSSASEEIAQFTSSYPDLLSIRQGTDALSGIAGHAYVRGIVSNGDRPDRVRRRRGHPDAGCSRSQHRSGRRRGAHRSHPHAARGLGAQRQSRPVPQRESFSQPRSSGPGSGRLM